MKVKAPAKINLYLTVDGRLSSGFHEITTVMQPVSLFDEIDFAPASKTRVTFAPADFAPVRPDLVERAIDALGASYVAHVLKRIPARAGLGGGSSDAAATLLALNQSLSQEKLAALGATLGSDVCFFLQQETAVCRGRGEMVSPVRSAVPLHWVIVVPDEGLSTAEVYARFNELAKVPAPPTVDALLDALAAGDTEGIAAHLSNDLEVAAIPLLPEIASIKESLMRAGALGATMSGSGSAVAGLFQDDGSASEASSVLASQMSHNLYVVSSLS